MSILTPEIISSEERDTESDSLVIKPLPWRSAKVDEMFRDLDKATVGRKSSMALRQRRSRILGDLFSTRSMPTNLPPWAIKH